MVDAVDKLKQFSVDMEEYCLVDRKNADKIFCDNQDKIKFAIGQLEKVRTQFRTKYSWYEETHRVCEKTDDFVIWLDNQIKQLKEMK